MLPKFAVESCIEGLLSNQRLRIIKRHAEDFGVDPKPAVVGYVLGGLTVALNYKALVSGETVIDVVVPVSIRYAEDWGQKIVESVKPLIKEKLPRCEVELAFLLKREHFWKHDVDNLAGTVLNTLKSAGVYDNDACVLSLKAQKHPTENDEAVHIIIRKKEEF